MPFPYICLADVLYITTWSKYENVDKRSQWHVCSNSTQKGASARVQCFLPATCKTHGVSEKKEQCNFHQLSKVLFSGLHAAVCGVSRRFVLWCFVQSAVRVSISKCWRLPFCKHTTHYRCGHRNTTFQMPLSQINKFLKVPQRTLRWTEMCNFVRPRMPEKQFERPIFEGTVRQTTDRLQPEDYTKHG